MFGFGRKKKETAAAESGFSDRQTTQDGLEPVGAEQKILTLPVVACGAGLFSDGYINNVIGSVSSILAIEYGDTWNKSQQKKVVSAIAFAGTIVGMLIFGFTSDRWSRTNSLLVSTLILCIFTILAAASYWHGQALGMFTMLAIWRFFVGIGIGGEYPAGSVGCAESTGEVRSGWRHFMFIMFTNSMIDVGFVMGAFVPYVVAAACHNEHYSTQWRTSLAIGAIFPVFLFVLRLFVKEPEEFNRHSMKHSGTPWKHVIKFYGFRLFIVSLIWFIYDFLTYPFGIYSSTILANVYGEDAPLTTVFGWNTVINIFYLPGTLIGAKFSDWLGPRWCLIIFVTLQAIVGFIMAGDYANLSKPGMVGGFAVVYGIFLSLGEIGPGNNIGLLAAKTCATGVRGRYYAAAAAIGKVGAFIGTYIFTYIEAAGNNATTSAQYPFYVSSSLGFLSAALAFFFLPNVGQETIQEEDAKFRAYLESQGWDTSRMGLKHEGAFEESEEIERTSGLNPGAADAKA